MTQSSIRPGTDPDVERSLLDFLSRHTKRAWEPDVDLFASGAVSSLFAMQLVVFLESTFDVVVGGDDLTLDNFRSVNAMTALVGRLRAGAGDE